jgi:hypothetical protein
MSHLFEATRLLRSGTHGQRIKALCHTCGECRWAVSNHPQPWGRLLYALVYSEHLKTAVTGPWISDVLPDTEHDMPAIMCNVALSVAANLVARNATHITSLLQLQDSADSDVLARGVIIDSERLHVFNGDERVDLAPECNTLAALCGLLFRWWRDASVLRSVPDEALLSAMRITRILTYFDGSATQWSISATSVLCGIVTSVAPRCSALASLTLATILVKHAVEDNDIIYLAGLVGFNHVLEGLLRVLPLVHCLDQRSVLIEGASKILPFCDAPVSLRLCGGLDARFMVEAAIVLGSDGIGDCKDGSTVMTFTTEVFTLLSCHSALNPLTRVLGRTHATLTNLLRASQQYSQDNEHESDRLHNAVRKLVSRHAQDFFVLDAAVDEDDRKAWWWALDAAIPTTELWKAAKPLREDAITSHPMLPEDGIEFPATPGQILRLESVMRCRQKDMTFKNPFDNVSVRWYNLEQHNNNMTSF